MRKITNARKDYDRLITAIVKQNPGIRFCELARVSDIAYGTLQHRLALLEKRGLIQADRWSGAHARYYNSNISKKDMRLLRYLKRSPYLEIISLLLVDDAGGARFTFKEIVQKTGKSPSTISIQLRKLVELKVIRFNEKRGYYTVNNKPAIKRIISKYRL